MIFFSMPSSSQSKKQPILTINNTNKGPFPLLRGHFNSRTGKFSKAHMNYRYSLVFSIKIKVLFETVEE